MKTKPKKTMMKRKAQGLQGAWGVALVAGLLAIVVAPLAAGVSKAFDKVEHAAGWDTVDMKVTAKDNAGHATLETHDNEMNDVERKSSYHDNGKKADEQVLVTSKASHKVLYKGKRTWNDQGELTYAYEEDGSFTGDGKQLKGAISEKKYNEKGKLTSEVRKAYDQPKDAWNTVLTCDVDYYADGDMRSRVTEEQPSGEKTKETWGAKKGLTGRKKHTKKWDPATSEWK